MLPELGGWRAALFPVGLTRAVACVPCLQDLQVDQLIRRYNPNPVMVIIDVKPKPLGIPTEAYHAVEVPPVHQPVALTPVPGACLGLAVRTCTGAKPRSRRNSQEIREGKQLQSTFKHVTSEIGAMEAEEVGVEHLLRDVKDTTISTLANQVTQKLGSLKGLASRLQEIDAYLQNVQSGRLPINHQIIYKLQVLPHLCGKGGALTSRPRGWRGGGRRDGAGWRWRRGWCERCERCGVGGWGVGGTTGSGERAEGWMRLRTRWRREVLEWNGEKGGKPHLPAHGATHGG